ncbi:MAG TPA: isoaspartyl peptidase/L-asparaginase [Candidatus Binataceae bacterium]|nr:isoaspartyl peptidase/L-asparaginase [Candidatus Binataceae bacterium]
MKAPTVLVAHGGAGAAPLSEELAERKRGMLEAIRTGAAALLRTGALDAVVATVAALEDRPLFNAGYGSLLNSKGEVEMDASLMVVAPMPDGRGGSQTRAGAVAAVRRVKNPIMLARAVMELTDHVLMTGAGAEALARKAGLELRRPEQMITARARERWLARAAASKAPGHGTVGAVAIDAQGRIAAATSTGGVPGKLAGRVGDSAIIGAGTFAGASGAASATGYGEAIILTGLCREVIRRLGKRDPNAAAETAIRELIVPLKAEAGIVVLNAKGAIGFAHNASAMQVGVYQPANGFRVEWSKPIVDVRKKT